VQAKLSQVVDPSFIWTYYPGFANASNLPANKWQPVTQLTVVPQVSPEVVVGCLVNSSTMEVFSVVPMVNQCLLGSFIM